MDDLIRRQDVINAIDNLQYKFDEGLTWCVRMDIYKAIYNLPSTQFIDSVECKDCKFSEEFQGDIWLCKRCKKSVIVLPTDTCSKAKKG